ncbi:MAG: penicillin-binding protein 2, partial [Actinomycetota bacterium]
AGFNRDERSGSSRRSRPGRPELDDRPLAVGGFGSGGSVTIDANDGDPVGTRFAVVAVLVAVAMVVLAGRLAWVQLVSAPGYRDVATGNRIRVIETPAPRGRILDTEGRVLAGTRESFTVTMDWEALVDLDGDQRAAVFAAAATELALAGHPVERSALEDTFQRARRQALRPVTVAEDVDPELWIALTERALPGIAVTPIPVRTYPYGQTAGHVVGYIGVVADDSEAASLNRAVDHGYRAGSEIGRGGLERIFERRLRGTPEIRTVEVDSRNRVVRTVDVTQRAVPGQDVHLTLDIELQQAAERALAEQLAAVGTDPETPAPAGSFVVLDPTDGAVLALASLPGFDPAAFVFGLAEADAEQLLSDPTRPFLNRATNGLYPAGSTFKPVPAYAALTAGIRGQYERWNDQGTYRLQGCRGDAEAAGCVFQNAKGVVMGPVDVRAALTRSSDTYFYSLGERFWVDRDRYGDEPIQQAALRFGLGAPTGIELPGEAGGRVPGPAARQADHDRYPDAFPDPRWYTGDNVNLSIGQGELLVTPLQLANLYATLAAGGTRHQPRLVREITDGAFGRQVLRFDPRVVDDRTLDATATTAIIDGLLEVPTTGTAAVAFGGFPTDRFPLAAKTGTAEVDGQADNALFAGFGPWPNPRYAFAVVLEEAGFGGEAAAPVVRRFFDQVNGFPAPPIFPDPAAPTVEPAGGALDLGPISETGPADEPTPAP